MLALPPFDRLRVLTQVEPPAQGGSKIKPKGCLTHLGQPGCAMLDLQNWPELTDINAIFAERMTLLLVGREERAKSRSRPTGSK